MDNQQPSIKQELFYRKPRKGYGFIYKYTGPNGMSYIGQTVNSLNDRARTAINGKGYKKCTVFWRGIQKYGWSKFVPTILEEVEIEKLNEREIYYINYFNTLAPNGYNIVPGGEGGKRKEVFAYSAQNGNFLEHYSSLSEAEINTGVPLTTICNILNKDNKYHIRQSHNLTFTDHYISQYDVSQLARNNYHTVYVYDKDGNYLNRYDSVSAAAKDLNIGASSIYGCISKTKIHASYYQFRDELYDKIEPIPKNSKTPISVCQIDPNTQEVIAVYPSCAAAGRAIGLTSGQGIKKVAQRGKGLSGGYFWKFNEGSTTKCSEIPAETVRDSIN